LILRKYKDRDQSNFWLTISHFHGHGHKYINTWVYMDQCVQIILLDVNVVYIKWILDWLHKSVPYNYRPMMVFLNKVWHVLVSDKKEQIQYEI
jgi:hypothetical protein